MHLRLYPLEEPSAFVWRRGRQAAAVQATAGAAPGVANMRTCCSSGALACKGGRVVTGRSASRILYRRDTAADLCSCALACEDTCARFSSHFGSRPLERQALSPLERQALSRQVGAKTW